MKILYHFRVKGVGPERVHISGIAGAFEKLGHTVAFVSPTDIDPLKSGDVAPQEGLLRALLYFLADKTPQVAFEIMEILYNVIGFSKLKRAITAAKPRLIYERYAFFCVMGGYLAKKHRIPFVLEVNEVGGFDRVRAQKLVWLSQKFERYIFSSADLIVTVSDFLKEQIVARGGRRENVLIVPNGIDPDLFTSIEHRNHVKKKLGLEHATVIGFVGYLVHWHRLEKLMEVFAEIKATRTDAVLLLVGDGVLRGELETKAKGLGIEDSVIITGRVDHGEVPDFINIFDVAVIPNSNEYRSPIKMFEYMAMAKAIVAPDQSPILHVMRDNIEGFIFKNGRFEDLYAKIEYALDNPGICQSMGCNARKLVTEKFTWEIHARTILDVLGDS
jgi:glycosyltransferase involved in cell wall biosynthesis